MGGVGKIGLEAFSDLSRMWQKVSDQEIRTSDIGARDTVLSNTNTNFVVLMGAVATFEMISKGSIDARLRKILMEDLDPLCKEIQENRNEVAKTGETLVDNGKLLEAGNTTSDKILNAKLGDKKKQ